MKNAVGRQRSEQPHPCERLCSGATVIIGSALKPRQLSKYSRPHPMGQGMKEDGHTWQRFLKRSWRWQEWAIELSSSTGPGSCKRKEEEKSEADLTEGCQAQKRRLTYLILTRDIRERLSWHWHPAQDTVEGGKRGWGDYMKSRHNKNTNKQAKYSDTLPGLAVVFFVLAAGSG